MSGPGNYLFQYAGGSFPVALRPSGVFYCPSFPANAKYEVGSDGTLLVDWGAKFGKYTFTASSDGWDGCKLGEPQNWRKMQPLSPFTAEESLLMGDGGGSSWGFQWEKGEFDIELQCDGYNHFVCRQFPAHSHWTSSTLPDGKCKIDINWGQYGEYEMVLDAATKSMVGCKKGQPTNWRKAYWKGPLGMDVLHAGHAHDHAHSHSHGETCSHPH